MRVLMTGATGRNAGLVLPELTAHGVAVRALVRSQAKADAAPRAGADQTALGAEYDAHGFHGGNDLILRTILDRRPRTLTDFISELVAQRGRRHPSRPAPSH